MKINRNTILNYINNPQFFNSWEETSEDPPRKFIEFECFNKDNLERTLQEDNDRFLEETTDDKPKKEINKDFYGYLPGFICGICDDIIKSYKDQEWFDAFWEEYRNHILSSTIDEQRMPGFYLNKYTK